MFMQKIEAPRVTCNLFDVVKGWTGTGLSSNAPRQAGEAEARAYADFIRRKCDLPELSRPTLHSQTIGGGRGSWGHFHYIGATYGDQVKPSEYCSETRERIPAQYAPGAFSVLFPGANQMRAKVTLETLGDDGEAISSQTMPVEPKKGGIVWSKDDVRKACGPVAKVKAARTPTPRTRKAAPTMAEQDKRRRAVMRALKLRAELRREREISQDRWRQVMGKPSLRGTASARQMPEDCVGAASGAPVAAKAARKPHAWPQRAASPMRDLFRALYGKARAEGLTGAALYQAAIDLTGKPAETFHGPIAQRLYNAVAKARENAEPMRYKLGRLVLNCWGHGSPYRAPMMDSPRFAAWQRTTGRADALRDRLKAAGRLEFDAGNWVVRVLPLPVTPEPAPAPTAIARKYRALGHERAIKRAWAERKARREAQWQAAEWEEAQHRAWSEGVGHKIKRRRAVLKAREMQSGKWERNLAYRAEREIAEVAMANEAAAKDRARLAESIAEDHLRMREQMRGMLAALERRAEAAEAENAELWAEIEKLTAPAIPVQAGAA